MASKRSECPVSKQTSYTPNAKTAPLLCNSNGGTSGKKENTQKRGGGFLSVDAAEPSALARNGPTLLAKNCQHHTEVVTLLPMGKSAFLPRAKSSACQGPGTPARECVGRPSRFFPENERLTRAVGADDGDPTRTPAAWMIMPIHSLLHAKSRSKSCSQCGSL